MRQAFRAAGLRPAPLSPEALRQISREAREDQLRWRTPAEEEQGFIALAGALLGGPGAARADSERLGRRLAR